ncbi:biotin synthase BioB [Chitinispirillales bacterium ANBcel5]|uniref:biotin synthase BioB n=1 Tax=Cellulosispirillum alkaliphilum TaxID=3039283 RepID=UPI002A4FC500|nr:biotin synthase BioB [Chitinispirillales bacterium ANBcel5]
MDYLKTADELFHKSVAGKLGDSDYLTIANWPVDRVMPLFAAADLVRSEYCSTEVDPCTLMNIKSGNCSEDCAFCTQSAHNSSSVSVKDLTDPEEIKRGCEDSFAKGFPFCVVSSGKKLNPKELQTICHALSSCKGEKHASLGLLTKEEFAMLRDAGVVCYNHNLETSRSFFPQIVTTHTYQERVDTVKRAKENGLSVCCGGIFGMGESWEQRVEFCRELKGLDVDTVPINFLNAVPGTRLRSPEESPLELLKIVSLFRLAMPQKTIKVCGGREVNLGPLQSMIFFAGANGYVSGGYLTTPGAGLDADDKMIAALGLEKRLQGK